MNRERHKVRKQAQGLEFIFFVKGLAFAASQSNQPYQPPANSQGRDALEQLGCHVPIRAEEDIVSARIEHCRTSQRAKRVNMLRKQGDDRRLGQQGKNVGYNRSEEGGFIAKTEKSAFTGTGRFPQRGEHGACSFGKFPRSEER